MYNLIWWARLQTLINKEDIVESRKAAVAPQIGVNWQALARQLQIELDNLSLQFHL